MYPNISNRCLKMDYTVYPNISNRCLKMDYTVYPNISNRCLKIDYTGKCVYPRLRILSEIAHIIFDAMNATLTLF